MSRAKTGLRGEQQPPREDRLGDDAAFSMIVPGRSPSRVPRSKEESCGRDLRLMPIADRSSEGLADLGCEKRRQ